MMTKTQTKCNIVLNPPPTCRAQKKRSVKTILKVLDKGISTRVCPLSSRSSNDLIQRFSTGRPQHVSRVGRGRLRILKIGLHAE